MKILIALATYNRPYITTVCLDNLSKMRSHDVKLVTYDDGSTAYDHDYIKQFSDEVIRFQTTRGITRSRAKAFRDFVHRYTEFDLLYLTDNDTVHDPVFTDILRKCFQQDDQIPLSLYNTRWHNSNEFSFWDGYENIIGEDETYFYSKLIPGVSHCYTREMAQAMVDRLNHSPDLEHNHGWDIHFTNALGKTNRFTKISYLEHFARDRYEGGMHIKMTASPDDFEINRADNPTPYLQSIRQQVIDHIIGP